MIPPPSTLHTHNFPPSLACSFIVSCSGLVQDGHFHFSPVEIGSHSFVGNGAVVRCGTKIHDRALISLTTLAPMQALEGKTYLGSPPMLVEAREKTTTTNKDQDNKTYRPPIKWLVGRY